MTQKHPGPGKAHRKGLSLVDIMRKFPDDATAGGVVRRVAMGRYPRVPALRLRAASSPAPSIRQCRTDAASGNAGSGSA